MKVPRATQFQGPGVHLCLVVGGLSPKTTDLHLLTFYNQEDVHKVGGEGDGEGTRETESPACPKHSLLG